MSHTFWILLASLMGMTVLTACEGSAKKPPKKAPVKQVTRYGSVIGLKADKIDQYKKLHAAIWPEVAKAVKEANLRNYSIYLRKMPDGKHYLFSYFEYAGKDFNADMARLAVNPEVKRWWKVTDACQEALPDRKPGEWWAPMEEVFHQD